MGTMIEGYKIVQIPRISDNRGSISFAEVGQLLDWSAQRVYWLYDITQERGGHAHKKLKQFMFCVHGSLDVILDDGINKESVLLDSPDKVLIIDKPLWREINNFKNNPCLVVLASDVYSEADYIRSYEEFKKWKSHS
jgi:dTDP-4-dehydrorhamnose 3,5-epimerase-like enzyme